MLECEMEPIGYGTEDIEPGDMVYILGYGYAYVPTRNGKDAPMHAQKFALNGEYRVFAVRDNALQVVDPKGMGTILFAVPLDICLPLSLGKKFDQEPDEV